MMMAAARRKPSANELLGKVKQLKLIESDITYIMKEKFTELTHDRRVSPIDILQDGDVASQIAQDCFNDQGSRMCDLGENGVDEKETCRIAKALIQMNYEM